MPYQYHISTADVGHAYYVAIKNRPYVGIGVTFYIQIKVPNNNVLFNMAYVFAESGDGLHSTSWGMASTSYYGTFFPPSLRVNGAGALVDFVNPQLSVVVPGSSLDNDIITIPFNATADTNSLSHASQVYLCATGYTSAGDSIKVCEQTSKTQLSSTGAGNWQLNIWPRGFFNLAPNQTLDSMKYVFTDGTGGSIVGYSGKPTPFLYLFSCQ